MTRRTSTFEFDDAFLRAFVELKEKLTSSPIIISLDWEQPIEVMCDVSGVALDVVLGQRIEKIIYPIKMQAKSYILLNRTTLSLNMNFSLCFSHLKSFGPICMALKLLCILIILHEDLTTKKDVKLILITWVLLLKEFDFEVKGSNGT